MSSSDSDLTSGFVKEDAVENEVNGQINHHETFTPLKFDNCKMEFWLNIENLTVQTKEEKPWYRRKPTKPKNIILDNGTIKSGELVALLGPSGSGKTTFLACVGGKSKLPSSGRVSLNGVDVRDVPKGMLEIVPQFDVLVNSITVMEHLTFMTEMKLGGLNVPSNRAKLEALMVDLMLKSLCDSTIQSLSGGEMRLLSLATSLLSSPQVIICDEPTTGLDSFNASLVVGVLKHLSESGITVICSIHQPSSFLIREFNNLMLMAEGKLLFHGSHEECMGMFESINLPCPKNYNPAEFYIRAISTDPNTKISHVGRILEKHQTQVTHIYEKYQHCELPETNFKFIQRSWCMQTYLLLWRHYLTLKKEKRSILVQYVTTLFISCVINSLCFSHVDGRTQSGIQDAIGLIWVMTSDTCYNQAYNAVHAFQFDYALFKREVGIYHSSAFYVSRFLAFIPRCVIHPAIYILVTSMLINMPEAAITYSEMFVALVFVGIASMSYGLAAGCWVLTTGISDEAIPTLDLPLFLMAGNFLKLTSLPGWLLGVRYVSHFFYGMDIMCNIYWRKVFYIDCPNPASGCISNGYAVLESYGYSTNAYFLDSIGVACLAFGWGFLGYLGLKNEERKGYAF